jgi:hypothetical protein
VISKVVPRAYPTRLNICDASSISAACNSLRDEIPTLLLIAIKVLIDA